MSYPNLEDYNEALQHPQAAFLDDELKEGRVKESLIEVPLAICGGFALTYTVETVRAKYAVRCFHKQTKALEERYIAISGRLKAMKSKYFLNFDFQPQGVLVNGKKFPIVKMDWASGKTLGEFLEGNFRNKGALQQLNSALHTLANFLREQKIAHGDVQPGNIMVSNEGRTVQLIDYDGMFVDELSIVGSEELGHRNFQHPQRTNNSWNSQLDRFSFIALNFAIRGLMSQPDLWEKTQSDGDGVLFKANDFADPDRSSIFKDLSIYPQFTEDTTNFAAVCKTSFDKIPTLEDFLARKNIPQVVIKVSTTSDVWPTSYLSAFPVLDAGNYSLCLQHVGDRVEVIGRIIEIKEGKTRNGKPYIFVNFGSWRGNIFKITIWSEGFCALAERPDQSWIGRCVSAVGLMEPPFRSPKYEYSHLSISITRSSQLHEIAEEEARFRLGFINREADKILLRASKKKLDEIRSKRRTLSTAQSTGGVPQSQNQAVLRAIRASRPKPEPQSQFQLPKPRLQTESQKPKPQPSHSTESAKSEKTNSDCFIATTIYGADAPETNALRAWRDRTLMPSLAGRMLVRSYYDFSPRVVPLLKRNERIASIVRVALSRLLILMSDN